MCGVIITLGRPPQLVVGGQRFLLEYVETGTGYCARFDGVGEVVYFAHFAASDVDEISRWLHQGEASRVEHAFGFGSVWGRL